MTAGAGPTPSHKILVVDDEPDVRLLLTLILDAAGYDVETAADGHEALLMLEDTRPDLLLLDLMMPAMDGWQVIEQVRASPSSRDLPIVAMSAKFGLIRTMMHGVHAFVPKPFDADILLDIVDEVLGQESASASP